jgi:F-type H+-transporting ATPase subunit delta
VKSNKKIRRAARELFRLCLVDGVLDEDRARVAASRLAASERRGALDLLVGFQRLARLDRHRYTAVVESATPLVEPVRAQIGARLSRAYGTRLETLFVENRALIGGVRIKVGSDVYDGSIRAKLAALEARL